MAEDNYNVAPGQRLPVIIGQKGKRVAEPMKWGFVPAWSKNPNKGLRPINTKSESLFLSSMWRNAIQNHRCLIPSRGFFEWQQLPENRKVPYFIHPKDQKLFAFAGIYSIWKDAEDYPLLTFSIITTTPNKEMQPIHNRMPVILEPEQEELWLAPAYSEQELSKLLVPYKVGKLDIYRVSEDVNSPRNNDKHLVDAVAK
jgi:putative SOS response-associated peptidase YedK